jgi:hypothetical protein
MVDTDPQESCECDRYWQQARRHIATVVMKMEATFAEPCAAPSPPQDRMNWTCCCSRPDVREKRCRTSSPYPSDCRKQDKLQNKVPITARSGIPAQYWGSSVPEQCSPQAGTQGDGILRWNVHPARWWIECNGLEARSTECMLLDSGEIDGSGPRFGPPCIHSAGGYHMRLAI